ncbi:hypothetical protein IAU59_007590 [Kwoniella sp. CBS 9459]
MTHPAPTIAQFSLPGGGDEGYLPRRGDLANTGFRREPRPDHDWKDHRSHQPGWKASLYQQQGRMPIDWSRLVAMLAKRYVYEAFPDAEIFSPHDAAPHPESIRDDISEEGNIRYHRAAFYDWNVYNIALCVAELSTSWMFHTSPAPR